MPGWLMDGGNPQRTNRQDGSINLPMVFHEVYHTGYLKSQVMVVDQSIYFRNDSGLFAMDMQARKLAWEYPMESARDYSAPVVTEELVTFGGDAGMYGVDRATGKGKWKVPGAAVAGSPLVVDGLLYYGDLSGVVREVDVTTGKVNWDVKVGAGFWSSLAAIDNRLVCPSPDRSVYAVDTRSHQVLWKVTTGGGFQCDPVADGSTVFVASEDSFVYAIDARTGKIVWKYRTLNEGASHIACGEDGVFVAGNDGITYALRKDDGRLLWQFAPGRIFNRSEYLKRYPHLTSDHCRVDCIVSLISLPGLVLGGMGNGYLYALDAGSGAVKWKEEVGCSYDAPMTIADGKLFVPLYGGIGTTACYEPAPKIDFSLNGQPVALSGPLPNIRNGTEWSWCRWSAWPILDYAMNGSRNRGRRTRKSWVTLTLSSLRTGKGMESLCGGGTGKHL